MRIETLRLDDWGHFQDAELQLGAGLVVVHGPNEAGKSTLQRALTSLLFGIPPRLVNDAWRVGDRKKLRLGAHVSFADGTEFDVRRSHHRAPADVRGIDDEPLDAESRALLDRAVEGLDAAAFDRRFALDHARLRAGGDELAQQEGSLGETLFAAASGVVDLRGVLTELRGDRDRFYNGLRKGVLHDQVKAFRDASAELVRDRGDVDRLGELRATRTRLRTRLEQSAGQRARIDAQLQELTQVSAARAYLAEWNDLQARRAEAGSRPHLDARSAARVTQLVTARASDHAARTADAARLARLEAQHAELRDGSRLAGLADRAGELARSIGAAQSAERQLAAADTRLAAARARLAALQLPDADAAALLRAALAAARGADLAHVRRTGQELVALRSEADAVEQELVAAGVSVDADAAAALTSETARAAVAALTVATDDLRSLTEEHRAAVEAHAAAEAALVALGASTTEAAPTAERLRDARTLRDARWGAVHGAWRSGDPYAPEVADEARAATVDGDRLADALAHEAAQLEQVRAARVQLAQLAARAETAALQVVTAEDAARDARAAWTSEVAAAGLPATSDAALLALVAQLDTLRAHRTRARALAAQLTHDVERLEDVAAPLRARIDAEAPPHPRDADLQVQAHRAASHVEELVERADARIRAVDVAQQEEQGLRGTITDTERDRADAERVRTEFLAATRQLSAAALELDPTLSDVVGDISDADAPRVATLLDERCREAHARARELDQVTATRTELTAAIEEIDARLASSEAELRSLFDAAGLTAPSDLATPGATAELEAAARDAQAWNELDAERHAFIDRLRAAAGDAVRPEHVFPQVERLDAVAAAERQRALDDELATLDAQRIADDQELEQTLSHIGVIEQSGARGDLLTAREAARARIVEHAERWLPLALGEQVLAETIDAWRAAHQSPVLAHASEYFRLLTGGRYVALAPDEETGTEQLVAVPAPDDAREQVARTELSEGTRDQLYLALRLGSIEDQLATRSEPLPVVLDDVLITSDARRVRAALEALMALGSRTQVLLLTHSTLVRDIAAELASPGACTVVELGAVVTPAP